MSLSDHFWAVLKSKTEYPGEKNVIQCRNTNLHFGFLGWPQFHVILFHEKCFLKKIMHNFKYNFSPK